MEFVNFNLNYVFLYYVIIVVICNIYQTIFTIVHMVRASTIGRVLIHCIGFACHEMIVAQQ